MNRFYDGQLTPIQDLMGDLQKAEESFLQDRYQFSERALALLVEAGGVTRSEHEFTLAMHGFSEGDLLSHMQSGVIAQYGEIRRLFGESTEQPVAEFEYHHEGEDAKVLRAIGRVPFLTWDMRAVSESTLQYRAHQLSGNNFMGFVELPVEQHHEWTEARWFEKDSGLIIKDKTTMTVARVKRTASAYGDLRNMDRAVEIDNDIKVGWQMIMRAYEFDERAHPRADSNFLERITAVKAHFEVSHPIVVAAD